MVGPYERNDMIDSRKNKWSLCFLILLMNVGRRSSQLWFCRAFVRKIEGRIPTRYWQQVKNGDHVYYVDTDTYKKTTEQPEEFVPFEAMESRLVRLVV